MKTSFEEKIAGGRALSKAKLDDKSLELRKTVIDTAVAGGRGHIGPALSLLEIIRVLYDDILQYDSKNPRWKNRDRFILSKGHGCLALYAVLAEKGFFDKSHLDSYCKFDSILGGHPEYGKIPGVEASTGSLGHGLSIGVGMALAAKIDKAKHKIFVLIGDGESTEGSNWEAAMHAAKHQLDNLVLIVDYNKQASYGSTFEIVDLEPFVDKWKAFGFAVKETDGHDLNLLKNILQAAPFEKSKPSALICHTVKGRGLPEAENNPSWHHKAKITIEEAERLLKSLSKD